MRGENNEKYEKNIVYINTNNIIFINWYGKIKSMEFIFK